MMKTSQAGDLYYYKHVNKLVLVFLILMILLFSVGLSTCRRRLAANHTSSNIGNKASRGHAYVAEVRVVVSKIVKIGKNRSFFPSNVQLRPSY